MSLLSSLTLVQSNATEMRTRGINTMRQKLIDRIGDQIALAQASETGNVNRRANGTPYRRAKGTPFHDGARLIGHAPLR
ncbi:hypothetical protein FHS93_002077, partial [Sphingobium francense]|nr:hypothetical protein [Sphingobium indicum]